MLFKSSFSHCNSQIRSSRRRWFWRCCWCCCESCAALYSIEFTFKLFFLNELLNQVFLLAVENQTHLQLSLGLRQARWILYDSLGYKGFVELGLLPENHAVQHVPKYVTRPQRAKLVYLQILLRNLQDIYLPRGWNMAPLLVLTAGACNKQQLHLLPKTHLCRKKQRVAI